MSEERVSVHLVLADHGSFHDLVVRLPVQVLGRYERLIDALREEPRITGEIFVDPRRLVAAYVEDGAGPSD
ncbi:MAG TPA: hypothetical protein VF188_18830 [Longimicrobiales bacterium]